AEANASGVVALINAHSPEELVGVAERVETGVPEWLAALDGQWLAAPLSASEQRGWLLAWSPRGLADEECSRRLGLMRGGAQRVGLVLERDALLGEAAELEALRTVDRAKSDFIATTAHELRTPLTSLQGYTELLRNPVDPALRDRWLGIVHVEAAQLGQVVDQLLDVSRLDQGRFHADRIDFELSAVTDAIVAQFAEQATLSGHVLTVGVSRSTHVFADAGHVERVLRNLVSNALKYSPDGGPVTIEAAEA